MAAELAQGGQGRQPPARPDRRELNRMLRKLAPGDVVTVTVTRIECLARSTFDLFGIVKRIVDAKAQFRSLAEPGRHRHQHRALDARGSPRACRCRTRSYPHSDSRRQEPRQGSRKAYGPTSFPEIPEQQKQAIRRRAQGATLDELAPSYNVSRATISRLTA
jgi:DNA invertase Pin-like site-specific DNA recombinase